MQTSDRTRGVALLVPRLLSIQADPAEHETADALAEAVERAAEALLRWHDEIAGIGSVRTPLPTRPEPAAHEEPPEGPADVRAAHASPRLAEWVRRGVIPADPASLEVAASELRSIARSVERVATTSSDESIRSGGSQIARFLQDLALAIRDLADTLRTEARRLADGDAEDAPQVLGRIVRAEHAVRRIAAANLRV